MVILKKSVMEQTVENLKIYIFFKKKPCQLTGGH